MVDLKKMLNEFIETKPYKKILAWQKGYQLVLETYKLTKKFHPKKNTE